MERNDRPLPPIISPNSWLAAFFCHNHNSFLHHTHHTRVEERRPTLLLLRIAPLFPFPLSPLRLICSLIRTHRECLPSSRKGGGERRREGTKGGTDTDPSPLHPTPLSFVPPFPIAAGDLSATGFLAKGIPFSQERNTVYTTTGYHIG